MHRHSQMRPLKYTINLNTHRERERERDRVFKEKEIDRIHDSVFHRATSKYNAINQLQIHIINILNIYVNNIIILFKLLFITFLALT